MNINCIENRVEKNLTGRLPEPHVPPVEKTAINSIGPSPSAQPGRRTTMYRELPFDDLGPKPKSAASLGVAQPSPVSGSTSGKASSLSSHFSEAFRELAPHLEAPSFRDLRYEEDVWPPVVKDEQNMPTVGFPKGWDEQEWEAKMEAERQAAAERERERREESQRQEKTEPYSEPNYPGGDDIDMPNPDSGDPGGPRSLDPYLYQPQPIFNYAKAISAIAIR